MHIFGYLRHGDLVLILPPCLLSTKKIKDPILFRLQVYKLQSSRYKPSIRSNSRVLLVTVIKPFAFE